MADNHDEIERFLLDLANKARPFAQKDLEEVKEFAKTLGIEDVQPWDVPFISETPKLQIQPRQRSDSPLFPCACGARWHV